MIETATAACSVAVVDGGQVVARQHAVVGRGHAEQLLPMIASLPAGGRADSILVDCGPGSFTGVRVGIAAARALALGWSVPLAGYSSLALVAAAALHQAPRPRLAAVLEGGHGEVFMQLFAADRRPLGPLASLAPAAALAAIGDAPAVGSGVARLRALAPDGDWTDALPDAAEAVHLPPDLARLEPRPLYGRAPDAKPAVQR